MSIYLKYVHTQNLDYLTLKKGFNWTVWLFAIEDPEFFIWQYIRGRVT